jgi:predicted MPP superfamily phosphohydrolase
VLDCSVMEPKAPAQVCWIYASEDEPTARELLRFASVLEAQGQIQSTSLIDIERNQLRGARLEALSRADVAMFLCSPSLFEGPEAGGWHHAIKMVGERTRVVPVVLSSTKLPPRLASFQVLPHDGNPIMARRNRDEALLEVIQGLQEIINFRSDVVPEPHRVAYEVATDRSGPSQHLMWSPKLRLGDSDISPTTKFHDASLEAFLGHDINEIFSLDGPPTVTFVEPPRFLELQLALRTMGTGLIVEGPSKVGKSTAIRKAMEAMGVAGSDQIWWYGQRPPPLDAFRKKLDELLDASHNTWLFIDDFHHLEDEQYRRELASAMKVLADQPVRHGKVTLIGINPLGSSLVQLMPDLDGRFRIIRLDVDKDWRRSTKIAELIVLGERAANIRFKRRDEFVVAAAGSFFLAQYLCNMAAVKAGIHRVQQELVEIELGPVDVVSAIQSELAARFRAPMLDFAAFDAAPPPRGAGLSLLWLLARSGDGAISVREARLRFPMLGAAFDWFLASNLARCFQEHPHLKGLLYYNRATQTLTMENPQLKFYLRELDWEELAQASGHGRVRFHPEDGPVWPIMGSGNAAGASIVTATVILAEEVPTPGSKVPRRVLHLSDLHFATKDQATVWYSQLAADLREQQVDRLDALVVSGDLVNRADPLEYDAARLFLEQLMSGFSLSARHVVLVPGNHDVSWSLSEAAYQPYRRTRYAGTLVPGAYIEHSGGIIEVRDEEAYRKRFQPFAELYRAIKGVAYPLAYEEQATISDLADVGVCIVGLNSAWEIDHHYRDRASIHPVALANALLQLGAPSPARLRIAVFHHPIHSGEDARIRDAGFLQQLAVHGFRLVLHGHVHKADAEVYRYDRIEGGRRIELVAAGTFGAPTHEWVPGYPLQYNLLLVGPDRVTVETRCRREISGAWEPDARWRQGPGKDPLARYVIDR